MNLYISFFNSPENGWNGRWVCMGIDCATGFCYPIRTTAPTKNKIKTSKIKLLKRIEPFSPLFCSHGIRKHKKNCSRRSKNMKCQVKSTVESNGIISVNWLGKVWKIIYYCLFPHSSQFLHNVVCDDSGGGLCNSIFIVCLVLTERNVCELTQVEAAEGVGMSAKGKNIKYGGASRLK